MDAEAVYAHFNARAVDALLALMAPDVDWPNGWEGGRVHGREAVREYWTRQWAAVDSRVAARATRTRPDGRLEVTVDQEIRSHAGALLGEGTVLHVYTLDDAGLIARMDIEEPA